MGSMWELRAGRSAVILGKNYVPDAIMTVFQSTDRYVDEKLITEYEGPGDLIRSPSAYRNLMGYKASAKVLRERLSLMGYHPESVYQEALALVRQAIADEDNPIRAKYLEFDSSIVSSEEDLLDQAVSGLRKYNWMWPTGVEATPLDSLLEWVWEEIAHDEQDARFILALVLREVRGNTCCRLDLTDLASGGWLDWTDDLVPRAIENLQRETSANGKIIVLTEGRTDVEIVRAALDALRPDVSNYFTFLDFVGFKNPGGTDRVVSLAKGLAAAGVMNRVVVVLDNDAAGSAAERQLQMVGLPATFRVMRLPDQKFAKQYPTIGPSGTTFEDVNGRACSIEFMFGEDVLRAASGGALPAVRWSSYLGEVKDADDG